MAQNTIYTTAAIYINDNLVSEAMDVTIKTVGNHQRQKTLAKQFAGMSKGATVTEVSVNNAVPQPGFEIDITPIITNLEEIKLTVVAASSIMTVNGFLESGQFNKAVDSDAKLSFEFVGPAATWQPI